MPTYEYECQKCEHRFEAFQSMTAKPVQKCPKCGAKPRRLISTGAGFIFKGSGFYQTDYRSADYKKKAEAEKKPSGETKPTPKSDSKKDSGASSSITASK